MKYLFFYIIHGAYEKNKKVRAKKHMDFSPIYDII